MAKSIGERFMDFQVIQQVRWIRLMNNEVKEALKILNRVDAQLAAALKAADPEGAPYTKKRLEALRVQVTNMITEIHKKLEPVLEGNVKEAAALAAELEMGAFKRLMPAGLDITTPNLGVLQQAVVLKPFEGAPLADWTSQLVKTDLNRTWRHIVDGITSGTTTDEIIRSLVGSKDLRYKDGVREVTRRGLAALVRTTINHATNQGRQMVWEDNEEIIGSVRWVATLDTRTTPICRHRDGRVGPVTLSSDWTPPDGVELLDPPLARPPAHPNCRSTTVAVPKSWKELGFDMDELPPGTRASMNGQVPANQTYYEWLAKQSKDVQIEVLGQGRYDAWHRDGITPDRFFNDKGAYLSLDQIRQLGKVEPKEVILFTKDGVDFIANPIAHVDKRTFANYEKSTAADKAALLAWKERFVEFDRAEPTFEMIEIAKLKTFQSTIMKPTGLWKGSTNAIKVTRHKGELYLIDGNHRAAAALRRGDSHIRAAVTELIEPKPAYLQLKDIPGVDLSTPEMFRLSTSSFFSQVDNYLKMDPALFNMKAWPTREQLAQIPRDARANFLSNARLVMINQMMENGKPKRYQTLMRKLLEKHNIVPGATPKPVAAPVVLDQSARITTETLTDIKNARANGYSILTDEIDIEDHNVLIHREFDKDGKPRLVATFKLTKDKSTELDKRFESNDLPGWRKTSWHPTQRQSINGDLHEIDGYTTYDPLKVYELNEAGYLIRRVMYNITKNALNGYVRIEVAGDSLEAAEKLFAAIRRMEVKTTAPTKADRELVYLLKVGLTDRKVFDAWAAATRANPNMDSLQRLAKMKEILKAEWPDFVYGEYVDARQGMFQYGYVRNYRLDWLNDPRWAEFEAGNKLKHAWSYAGEGTTFEIFDAILKSGGSLSSLTDRIRRGISSARSASWGPDMETGGGDYFFTRLMSTENALERPGLVFKSRLAARTDAVSYARDMYGRTNDPSFMQKNRAKSIEELEQYANSSGNETILKGYQNLFDELEAIVVKNEEQQQELIALFKSHKIMEWPDGRKLEDVIIPQQ